MPWTRLLEVLKPHFYPRAKGKKAERPPVGLERLLRMYFLQQWYALADEALEDALYGSQASRNFADVALGRESVPDITILLKVRHLLDRRS